MVRSRMVMLQAAAGRRGRADATERLKVSPPRQEEEEERLDMGESSPASQRRVSVPPIPAVVDRRASVDTRSSIDLAPSYAAPPKHKAGVDTDRNWLDELWDEDSPGAQPKAAASGAKSPVSKQQPMSPQEQNAEDTVQAFLDENWDSDEE
jgi:hypothetical protein